MDEIEKIKYGLDGDLFETLMSKIYRKDKEIIDLKMRIQKLESRLPAYSIAKEPDFINIDSCRYTLNLASELSIEKSNEKLHVIGTILDTEKHPGQTYQYFLSKNAFEQSDLHQKEMILINMHKQLIHEVIKSYEKRGFE